MESSQTDPMSDLSSSLLTARSLLFVPANRTDRYAKALASGADMVIIDLEDSIAHDAKDRARMLLDSAWGDLADPERVIIRINRMDSVELADDAALCASLQPAGVIVPKAESAEALEALYERVGEVPLIPTIESAVGFREIDALAQFTGTARLAFGHIDFQADLGMVPGPEQAELAPARFGIVLASRAAGIAGPIDGITLETSKASEIIASTRRGIRFGFTGKLCIHPDQIEPVHAAFAPSAEDAAWARRVVEAAEAAKGGAVQVDGHMVDRAVILLAERVLALSSQTNQRGT
jgi:citrate lyase subunit beta/citryl-CoA lyase